MLYQEFHNKEIYVPEGVRKIYEGVIKEGRSIVINDFACDSDLVPIGSLYIDQSTQRFYVKKNNGRSSILPTDLFDEGAITDIVIGKNSIDGNRMRTRSIYNTRIAYQTISDLEIKDDTITGIKIKGAALENRHLSTNIVATNNLVDSCVTETKIATNAIKDIHIANSAIKSEHLSETCIKDTHLSSNSVQTNHINNESIDNLKLATGSITSNKIRASQVFSSHIAERTIRSSNIGDREIKTINVAENAIISSNIAPDTIQNNHVQSRQIDFRHLTQTLYQRIINSLEVIAGVGKIVNLIVTEGINTEAVLAKNLIATTGLFKNYLHVGSLLEVDGDVVAKGKVYNAVYNDLAEAYTPGEMLSAGDCVAIRDDQKVYLANTGDCIVGVVSDNYASCFGASKEELDSGEKIAIGLIGKIPTKVNGDLKLGDYICIDQNGFCKKTSSKQNAIGKALENKANKSETVMCLIFPS